MSRSFGDYIREDLRQRSVRRLRYLVAIAPVEQGEPGKAKLAQEETDERPWREAGDATSALNAL